MESDRKRVFFPEIIEHRIALPKLIELKVTKTKKKKEKRMSGSCLLCQAHNLLLFFISCFTYYQQLVTNTAVVHPLVAVLVLVWVVVLV